MTPVGPLGRLAAGYVERNRMRCGGCGEANEPDDAFCRWCGLPLVPEPVESPDHTHDRPQPPVRRRRAGLPLGPFRWRRWLTAGVAVLGVLAVVAAAGWWFWLRPAGTAQSVPDTLGMVPSLPDAPSRQWRLPASEVTTSCRVPGNDTSNSPGRRCELNVVEWPQGGLVGTVSKGTAGTMRVNELFGVSPAGRPTWRQEKLSALCTTPRFGTGLACADAAHSEVFAVDPGSGERLWTLTLEEPVTAIGQAGPDVYVYTGRGGRAVTRITAKGEAAWTVRAPEGFRMATPHLRPGEPPQPDALTVLHGGLVYLGPLKNGDGKVWAVNRRTGQTARTSASVLAVVREHSTGHLVPVTRQDGGRITVGETAGSGLGEDGEQPGLFLPWAVDDDPDQPWLLIEDTGPDALVHAFMIGEDAAGDPIGEKWYTAQGERERERPMAVCDGRKAVYRIADSSVSVSPADSEVFGTRMPTAGAVGFACDGTRIVMVDRVGVTAFTGSTEDPDWRLPLTGVTAVEGSSHGLLLSEDGGTTVSLYR